MGGLIPPPREYPVMHRIEDLRWRREAPERNFILCECGWRADGPEASFEREGHLRATKAKTAPGGAVE